MATNFPDSPSTNDTHSVGDLTWIWDGTVWKLTVPSSLAPAGSTTQVQYNSSGSFAGSANFTFDGTSTVTLASTDAGSSAAPIIELYRNSSSPADADYLGQIKFQGEDDGGGKVVYAKITAKIDDASNTTEDGIIEIAHQKAGSNNISARFTSSALKLINGTGLEVADGLLTLGSTAVTATAAELNILDGVTATASELNLLDGITAGTVSASLAVIPDSNKDISGFRNITSSGTGDITTKLEVLSDTEAHSGALAFYKSEAAGAARLDKDAVYGRLDFYGRTASDGYYLSAQVKALVGDYFYSDNQAPSDIEFSVTPVGQTAPVKKLVVRGGTSTTDSVALEIWHPGGDNKGGRVDFIDHDGTGLGYFGFSNNANWYIKNTVSSGNMFIECEGAIYIRAEGEYELSLTSNGLEPYTDSGYKLGASSKKFSEIYGDDIYAATLDISGNVDIDGTTNLDAVDIDGAVQIDNTVTVGVNDTGHDVIFYGATDGSYMMWDESADSLVLKDGKLVVRKDSSSAIVQIASYHDTEATTPILEFLKGDGSAASPSAVDNDAVLGRINFYGFEDSDSAAQGAYIMAKVDGTPGDGDMPTELLFATSADGSESPDVAMTISPDGDIKMGGSNNALWDQSDNALKITSSTNKTPDASWSGQFQIMAGSPSAYTGGIAIDSTAMWVGHNSGARDLYLATNETARLKIAADGEVTQPNIPAFRVANTSGGGGYLYNGSVDGTGVIVFGTDSGTGLYDNGNNYNTSTGLFTAPVTGYYFFSISIFKHTNYDNDTNTYWGLNTSNGQVKINHGTKGEDGGGTVAGVFYLDANDTCSGYCFSSLDIYSWRTQDYNSFQGILIG